MSGRIDLTYVSCLCYFPPTPRSPYLVFCLLCVFPSRRSRLGGNRTFLKKNFSYFGQLRDFYFFLIPNRKFLLRSPEIATRFKPGGSELWVISRMERNFEIWIADFKIPEFEFQDLENPILKFRNWMGGNIFCWKMVKTPTRPSFDFIFTSCIEMVINSLLGIHWCLQWIVAKFFSKIFVDLINEWEFAFEIFHFQSALPP